MREAMGGTWLFGLVITFIVFFASFLAISVNYSKAFHVKNNIVDLLSKYEGNNPCARKKIGSYLKQTGYLVLGSCPERDDATHNCLYNGYDLQGDPISSSSSDAYFWVSNDSTDPIGTISKKYYRVVIYFKVDLPIVGHITKFRIKGETESIPFPRESTTC